MLNSAHTKELTLARAYDIGLAHEVTKQNAQQWSHKSFKANAISKTAAAPKRRKTGGHVIDATERGTHQRGAALRRWNAGHVKRKDTSPRLADPDQKEGKTSRPNGPSIWMLQRALRMTATGIKVEGLRRQRKTARRAFLTPTVSLWTSPFHRRESAAHRLRSQSTGKP